MIHDKGYGNRGNFYGKGKGGFARYFQAGLDLLFPQLSHNRERQTWNNLGEYVIVLRLVYAQNA
jgi:hypothetical protein